MDPLSLVAAAHSAALRMVADADHFAYQGLASAARRHREWLAALRRRCIQLDHAYAFMRHITSAHVEAFLNELRSQVASTTTGAGSASAEFDSWAMAARARGGQNDGGGCESCQEDIIGSFLESLGVGSSTESGGRTFGGLPSSVATLVAQYERSSSRARARGRDEGRIGALSRPVVASGEERAYSWQERAYSWRSGSKERAYSWQEEQRRASLQLATDPKQTRAGLQLARGRGEGEAGEDYIVGPFGPRGDAADSSMLARRRAARSYGADGVGKHGFDSTGGDGSTAQADASGADVAACSVGCSTARSAGGNGARDDEATVPAACGAEPASTSSDGADGVHDHSGTDDDGDADVDDDSVQNNGGIGTLSSSPSHCALHRASRVEVGVQTWASTCMGGEGRHGDTGGMTA